MTKFLYGQTEWSSKLRPSCNRVTKFVQSRYVRIQSFFSEGFCPSKEPGTSGNATPISSSGLPSIHGPKAGQGRGAAECLPAVRSTDQSLAHLQVLMFDAVGPLTDLLEKVGNEDGEEQQDP